MTGFKGKKVGAKAGEVKSEFVDNNHTLHGVYAVSLSVFAAR